MLVFSSIWIVSMYVVTLVTCNLNLWMLIYLLLGLLQDFVGVM